MVWPRVPTETVTARWSQLKRRLDSKPWWAVGVHGTFRGPVELGVWLAIFEILFYFIFFYIFMLFILFILRPGQESSPAQQSTMRDDALQLGGSCTAQKVQSAVAAAVIVAPSRLWRLRGRDSGFGWHFSKRQWLSDAGKASPARPQHLLFFFFLLSFLFSSLLSFSCLSVLFLPSCSFLFFFSPVR